MPCRRIGTPGTRRDTIGGSGSGYAGCRFPRARQRAALGSLSSRSTTYTPSPQTPTFPCRLPISSPRPSSPKYFLLRRLHYFSVISMFHCIFTSRFLHLTYSFLVFSCRRATPSSSVLPHPSHVRYSKGREIWTAKGVLTYWIFPGFVVSSRPSICGVLYGHLSFIARLVEGLVLHPDMKR